MDPADLEKLGPRGEPPPALPPARRQQGEISR